MKFSKHDKHCKYQMAGSGELQVNSGNSIFQ